jgi:serpin B
MRRVATALALLALMPVVSPDTAADTPKAPADLAAGAVNGFAADLLRRVAADGGNLFVSPHSIAMAIAMVRAGAAGDTAKEIDATIHLPPDAATAFRELTKSLADVPMESVWKANRADGKEEVPTYALSIANGLFPQTGYPIKDAYRRTLASDYAAEFRDLDFLHDPVGARAAINGWVEEKTKQRIKDIVPPGMPPPDTKLVLANAIHFKAQWADAFNENATAVGPFTIAGGTDVKAKMMARTGSMMYVETDDAQVLEIPYRGGATSMLVVLPKVKDGLDAVVKSLTPYKLASLVPLASRRVALKLPKFTFTTPLDVTGTLKAMGMPAAFDGRLADFSGITDEKPLFIGAVLHKAFVAVDEAGTEAAAATVVMMRAGSAMHPEPPTPFVVDHPFLFLIRHRATGTILFAGRVVDPTAN